MFGIAVQAGFHGDVGRVLDSEPGDPGSRPGLSGNIVSGYKMAPNVNNPQDGVYRCNS